MQRLTRQDRMYILAKACKEKGVNPNKGNYAGIILQVAAGKLFISQKAWSWARSLARHAVPRVKSPSVFTFGKHLSLFLFLAKVIYPLNFFSQVEYLTTLNCGKEAFA